MTVGGWVAVLLPPVLVVATAASAASALAADRSDRVRRRLVRPRSRVGTATTIGRHRADRRLVEALPDVLDAVARATSSGLPVVEAWRRAADDAGGPVGADLHRLVADVDGGVRVTDALERWPARRPLPEVRLVVSVLGQAVASGGSVARAAHQVADVLRANMDARRVVTAQAAQARSSAAVVAAAPPVLLLLGALVDTTAVEILFTTPVGLVSLVAGLTLDGLAAWWMAASISAAERVGR